MQRNITQKQKKRNYKSQKTWMSFTCRFLSERIQYKLLYCVCSKLLDIMRQAKEQKYQEFGGKHLTDNTKDGRSLL